MCPILNFLKKKIGKYWNRWLSRERIFFFENRQNKDFPSDDNNGDTFFGGSEWCVGICCTEIFRWRKNLRDHGKTQWPRKFVSIRRIRETCIHVNGRGNKKPSASRSLLTNTSSSRRMVQETCLAAGYASSFQVKLVNGIGWRARFVERIQIQVRVDHRPLL